MLHMSLVTRSCFFTSGSDSHSEQERVSSSCRDSKESNADTAAVAVVLLLEEEEEEEGLWNIDKP